jgi:hypothetical protein
MKPDAEVKIYPDIANVTGEDVDKFLAAPSPY